MKAGKTMRVTGFGILIIITLVYALFNTHDLFFGTLVEVDTPKNGELVNTALVLVRGRAPNIALLTINGAKIIPRGDGQFEKEILLGLGYNVIEVKALDRFNRERKRIIELVYKPNIKATSTNIALY